LNDSLCLTVFMFGIMCSLYDLTTIPSLWTKEFITDSPIDAFTQSSTVLGK
jgi:hypothetical protein